MCHCEVRFAHISTTLFLIISNKYPRIIDSDHADRRPAPQMISYIVKYGEVWFDFPFQSNLNVALAFIFLPSILNAFKWYRRSQDQSFDGWF